MRHFSITVAAFTIPILLVGLVMEFALRSMPNDYAHKRQIMDREAESMEVLCLGNSHAFYGINPVYWQQKSFNASHISQSLDIDLAIFEKYYPRFRNLQVIIIPVSYFSLFSKVGTGIESWRVKNYCIYYDLNVGESLMDHSEVLSLKMPVNLGRLYNHYIRGWQAVGSSDFGFGLNDLQKSLKAFKLTAKTSAAIHKKIDDRFLNENTANLERIISMAKARNIKVILFTPPAHQLYRELLDRDQLNTTVNAVSALTLKHSNVIYQNYLEDNSFVLDDFYDSDHLNRSGAKKLSIKIQEFFGTK